MTLPESFDAPPKRKRKFAEPNTPENFWARVDKTGECWNWTGRRKANGYGAVRYSRKNRIAHRVAAYLSGMIASLDSYADARGGLVLHHCDNRLCCRPSHLYVGSQADNVRDALERDRLRIGARHPRAKLTEKQVAEIRTAVANGATMAEMARKFGLGHTTVRDIVQGRKWRSLRSLAAALGSET